MKKIYLTCSLLVALAMTSVGFAAGPDQMSGNQNETSTYGDRADSNDFSRDAGSNYGRTGYAGGSFGGGASQGDSSYGDSSYGDNYGAASGGSCAPACAPAACAEPACPPDRTCNDCYCLMCHYVPQYFTTTRCEYDACPQYKKCCRMVPQYYQKQCCRMVPQYYNVTCCKQVPQYYTTCSTVYRPRQVCERHVKYVPKYYYKHKVGCPQEASSCAPEGCAQ